MTERLYDKTLLKLQKICSHNELCSFDIRQKLQKTQLADNLRQKIILSLQRDGYIDDRRYATVIAETKLRVRHWGKDKIRMFLQQKEIDTEIIESVLKMLPEEVYRNVLSDLLKKKLITLRRKYRNKEELVVRLMKYGLERGFEEHLVQETITILYDEI